MKKFIILIFLIMMFSVAMADSWDSEVLNIITGANPAVNGYDICIDKDNVQHVVYNTGATLLYTYFDGSWSTPKTIVTATISSVVPEIECGSDDRIHLVFNASDGIRYTAFRESSNPRTAGTHTTLITNTTTNDFKIDITTNNIVHVVYSYSSEIFHTSGSLNNWATPVQISNTSTSFDVNPAIVIDSNNRPQIAWRCRNNNPNYYGICHKYWDGDSWESRDSNVYVFLDSSGTAVTSFKPSIDVDSSNNPHIVWTFNNSSNYNLLYKDWNGTAWDTPTAGQDISQTNNVYSTSETKIKLDENNKPYGFWIENNISSYYNIFRNFLSNDESSWQTTDQNITAQTSSQVYYYDVVMDQYSIPHIIYELNSDNSVKYLRYYYELTPPDITDYNLFDSTGSKITSEFSSRAYIAKNTDFSKKVANFIIKDVTDLSGLDAETDGTNAKAFIHGISSLVSGGEIDDVKLYIPKVSGSDSVYICPGADSIGDITTSCSSKVTLDSENPTSGGYTLDYYSDDNYYIVSGITSTGGGENTDGPGNAKAALSGSWSAENTLDIGTNVSRYRQAVCVDVNQNIHVFYTLSTTNLMHTEFDGNVWSTPESIYTGYAIYEQAICDDNGSMHVVLFDETPDDLVYVYKYINSSWAQHTIHEFTGTDNGHEIAITSDYNVQVTFSDGTEIYYAAGIGSSWTTPVQISGTKTTENFPSIAVGSNNNPQIAWGCRSGTPASYYLCHKYWDGDSWETRNSSLTLPEYTGTFARPSIKIDSSNNPHISYVDDPSTTDLVKYIYWDGDEWAESIAGYTPDLTSAEEKTRQTNSPQLYLMSNDIAIIFWQHTTLDIYRALLNYSKTSWITTEKEISDETFAAYDLYATVDQYDIPHLVYMLYPNPNYLLKYKRFYYDVTPPSISGYKLYDGSATEITSQFSSRAYLTKDADFDSKVADFIIKYVADLSDLDAETNDTTAKSFIHGVTSLINNNIIDDVRLYIPKVSNSDAVYICPGAESLSEVTDSCTGKVELDSDTPTSGGYTLDWTSDEDYYIVSGITSTGGGESGSSNTAPVVTFLGCSGTGYSDPTTSLTLTPGGERILSCKANIQEANGFSDVNMLAGGNKVLQAQLFQTNGTGSVSLDYGASDDNNTRYTSNLTNDCTHNAENSADTDFNLTCSFYIQYYANDGDWTVDFNAIDEAQATDSDSDFITILDLVAFDVNISTISFGDLDPGEESSTQIPIRIRNTGNVSMNMNTYGTDLTCDWGVIEVENIHYAFTDPGSTTAIPNLTYSTMIELTTTETQMSSGPNDYNVTQRINDTDVEAEDSYLYYKISIPEVPGVIGNCQGSLFLESDDRGD